LVAVLFLLPLHEPSSVGDVIAVISYLSATSEDGTFLTFFWPRLADLSFFNRVTVDLFML
jgi:hypothetical protein